MLPLNFSVCLRTATGRWLRRLAKRASQVSDLSDSIPTQGNFTSEQKILFQAGKGRGVQQEARSRRAWYKSDSASKRDRRQVILLSGLSFRHTEKIKTGQRALIAQTTGELQPT